MIDKNTDFYKYVDNYANISYVESVNIWGKLNEHNKYTIAIPTYKRVQYLGDAIESALAQDYDDNYNIMVIDNNPSRDDETEKFMESYKGRSNMSYFKNTENIGMAGNWNRLFELIPTDWVVMLHDDDMIYSNFLSRCEDCLIKKPQIDILKPREGNEYTVNPQNKKNAKIRRLIDLDFYYGNLCGTPSGMLFRRKTMIKSGGYNQDFYPGQDYCFHVRFASLFNFYVLDEVLMYYRIGVNESVRPEVQKKWLIDASFLIRQLLKKYKVPKVVINSFLARRTMHSYIHTKAHFNTEYEFLLSEIGLPNPTIWGVFSHFYIILFKVIYKFLHRS